MCSLLRQKLSCCLILFALLYSCFSFSEPFPEKKLPFTFYCNKKDPRLKDNAFSVKIKNTPEMVVTAVASSIRGSFRDVNQDCCMVSDRYVAVMDGHGDQGHDIAQHFAGQLLQGRSVAEAAGDAKHKIETDSNVSKKSGTCFSLIEFIAGSNVLKVHTSGDCTVVIMPQEKEYQEDELQSPQLPLLTSIYGGVMEIKEHFSLQNFLSGDGVFKDQQAEQYRMASLPMFLCQPSTNIRHSDFHPAAIDSCDYALPAKCRVCIYCDGIAVHPYEIVRLVINESLENALIKVHEVVEQRQGNGATEHRGLASEFGLQKYLETHSLDKGMKEAIDNGWIMPHDKKHEDNMTLAIIDIDLSHN